MSLHVLLIAHDCNPFGDLEDQIGWEWLTRLARRIPVTLVTSRRHRQAIESNPHRPAHVRAVYFDAHERRFPSWLLATEWGQQCKRTLELMQFERDVADWIRYNGPFDVVHRVTPTAWLPGPLLALNKPVVYGPVHPPSLQPHQASQGPDPLAVAKLLNRTPPLRLDGLLGELLQKIWPNRNKPSVILSTSHHQADDFPKQARVLNMIDTGIDPKIFVPAAWPAAPSLEQPLRVLYSGSLTPGAGLEQLLVAISRVRRQYPITLEIIGDGPQRQAFEDQICFLDLQDRTSLHGALNDEETAAAMRRCHVFCLPNLSQEGELAMLQAMACARPVITVAEGIAAELIDADVGHTIATGQGLQGVGNLTETLVDVIQQPQVWRQKGVQGLERACESYQWAAKIDKAIRLYHDITQPGRPNISPLPQPASTQVTGQAMNAPQTGRTSPNQAPETTDGMHRAPGRRTLGSWLDALIALVGVERAKGIEPSS